jgi:hypothetical protein
MAKVRFNKLIQSLSGRVGDLILYEADGQPLSRAMPTITAARTQEQQANSARFLAAQQYASTALTDPLLKGIELRNTRCEKILPISRIHFRVFRGSTPLWQLCPAMIPASQKANSSAWWRSGADNVIPAEVTAEYAKYAEKPEHRQGNGDNLSPKSLGFDPQRFTTDAASWHPPDTAVDCVVIPWGADRGGPPWCYGTDRSCVPKTARLLSPAATPSRNRRTQWAQFAHTATSAGAFYSKMSTI